MQSIASDLCSYFGNAAYHIFVAFTIEYDAILTDDLLHGTISGEHQFPERHVRYIRLCSLFIKALFIGASLSNVHVAEDFIVARDRRLQIIQTA